MVLDVIEIGNGKIIRYKNIHLTVKIWLNKPRKINEMVKMAKYNIGQRLTIGVTGN